MKKWILLLVVVLIAFVALRFFQSPKAETTKAYPVHCSHLAIDRLLLNTQNWKRWWPGESNGNKFTFRSYSYGLQQLFPDGVALVIAKAEDSARLELHVSSAKNMTSLFSWTMQVKAGGFLPASSGEKELKQNLNAFIETVNAFFNSEEAVYGMKITQQQVKDSSLISTRQLFSHYPSTDDLYTMIDRLKRYIQQKGGEANGAPMLNVYQEGNSFEAMVAIPTKSDLPSEGAFRLKKMVLGNILMAEVKGGIHRVLEGEAELEHYVNDYRKVAPAIPFQVLVTDRRQQPDSSQWITRLYYPVF